MAWEQLDDLVQSAVQLTQVPCVVECRVALMDFISESSREPATCVASYFNLVALVPYRNDDGVHLNAASRQTVELLRDFFAIFNVTRSHEPALFFSRNNQPANGFDGLRHTSANLAMFREIESELIHDRRCHQSGVAGGTILSA